MKAILLLTSGGLQDGSMFDAYWSVVLKWILPHKESIHYPEDQKTPPTVISAITQGGML